MSKRAEEAALKAYPVHEGASPQWIKLHLSGWDCAVFIQGYEQAEKYLGWHSVEECLPEIDEEVIVLTDELNTAPHYKIAFAHLVDETEVVNIDGKPYKPESHNGWNIPGVKYWMPCPKLEEEI